VEGHKDCKSCGKTKPLISFKKQSRNKLLRRNHCNSCTGKRCSRSPAKKAISSRKNHWRRYGIDITEELYQRGISDQKGACSICKRIPKALQVDHCHATGRTRGLLCSACNRALGMFQDNPEILETAIEYLKFSKFPIG